MARGNPDKLRPVRSKREASERGKAGGIKSGEVRRERKALKERLELLLAGEVDGVERGELLALALIQKGLSGDVKAFEVIRDTLGEKPSDKQQTEGSISVKWETGVLVTPGMLDEETWEKAALGGIH